MRAGDLGPALRRDDEIKGSTVAIYRCWVQAYLTRQPRWYALAIPRSSLSPSYFMSGRGAAACVTSPTKAVCFQKLTHRADRSSLISARDPEEKSDIGPEGAGGM